MRLQESNRLFLLFMEFYCIIHNHARVWWSFINRDLSEEAYKSYLTSLKWLKRRPSHRIQPFTRKFQRSDDKMWSNEWILFRGRGHIVLLFLFSTGFCEREAEAERDVFFWEKYMELPHHAGAGAGALPRRRSDARTADSLNSASFWSSRSTSRTCSWTHCLDGLDVDFFLPQEQSDQVWQRCRWRPGAPSKETGTMLQLYSSDAFFSYPTIVLRSRSRQCLQCPAPHVEGVVQARKKKVLVHGLLQRAPRLVGSSSWYSHLFVYGSMNCSETVSKSMSVCPQRR